MSPEPKNPLSYKRSKAFAEAEANKKEAEEKRKVAEVSRQFKIPATGDWDSPNKQHFKKLGKEFPKPTGGRAATIAKWKPLLAGLNPKLHERAAYIFEAESMALREMSEEDRAKSIGKYLKYIFPAIRKELGKLSHN